MNHIRTNLYSFATFTVTFSIYTTGLKTSTTDPYSTLYKLTAIILDIGQHRHFKPVTKRGNEKENIHFLIVSAYIGLAAIILDNVLLHKSVKAMVPPNLHPKISNYKRALQDISISNLKGKLLIDFDTILHSKIVAIATCNENTRKIRPNCPNYHEPQPMNWKDNIKIVLDSVYAYARK